MVEKVKINKESLEDKIVGFQTDDFFIQDGETLESLSKEFNLEIKRIGTSLTGYTAYEIKGKYNDIVRLYSGDSDYVNRMLGGKVPLKVES